MWYRAWQSWYRTTPWTASTLTTTFTPPPTLPLTLTTTLPQAQLFRWTTAWRRANVTRLVKAVHDAVKAADPTLRFGVSPQGNPDNDRNEQYTDLSVWLTASGADAVVDYLCPQIYWGYGYTLSSGSTRFAFENIVPAWCAMPRSGNVALYFGLGAYRVGTGDGGANADSVSQWCTGSALARQVTDLRSAGAGGWALYRYGSLFRSDESGLAAAERAALTALDG